MEKIKLQTMTRMALSLAVLILFEFFESNLLRMPQGGSISLASLVFLLVLPFFNIKEACVLFFAWRTLMLFLIPPFYVSLVQLILDYFVAYSSFLFVYSLSKRGSRSTLMLAIVIANIWRYGVHVITGTVYFGAYAQSEAVIVYSLIYNLTYMGPTLILQLILGNFLLPVIAKIIKKSDRQH